MKGAPIKGLRIEPTLKRAGAARKGRARQDEKDPAVTAMLMLIAAQLRQLEESALALEQKELAHFIGAAGELANLMVTRGTPVPAETH